MKLICKCGNVEELQTDVALKNFKIQNCNDGTVALICKNCNQVVYINLNSK
jgi:hypothetical protein